MKGQEYRDFAIASMERACDFSEKKYVGKKRDNGTPTTSHMNSTAMRGARALVPQKFLMALQLHDTLEDGVATPEEIARLFGTSRRMLEFGEDVARYVILLSKPHFIRGGHHWVFADEREYYAHPDEFPKNGGADGLFEERATVYDSWIADSGVLVGIFGKSFDQIDNLESREGVGPSKYMRQVRTIANSSGMKSAGLWYGPEDLKYIKSLFSDAGLSIELSTYLQPPSGPVVPLECRGRFRAIDLRGHPDPAYTFLTLYARNPQVLMVSDFFEIGLVPGLNLDYDTLLPHHFPGFEFERRVSSVPAACPVSEVIYALRNPISSAEREAVIRPDSSRLGEEGFVILEGGKPSFFVTLDALSGGGCGISSGHPLLARASGIYDSLFSGLARLYDEHVAPAVLSLKENRGARS